MDQPADKDGNVLFYVSMRYVDKASLLVGRLEEKLTDSFWLQEAASHFMCVFKDIATVSQQHFFLPTDFSFMNLLSSGTSTQTPHLLTVSPKSTTFIATLDRAKPIQQRLNLTSPNKIEDDE